MGPAPRQALPGPVLFQSNRSHGSALRFPSMLRLISVACLAAACCSSVLPVSLFLIVSAAMAETLKQLNPDADRVA